MAQKHEVLLGNYCHKFRFRTKQHVSSTNLPWPSSPSASAREEAPPNLATWSCDTPQQLDAKHIAHASGSEIPAKHRCRQPYSHQTIALKAAVVGWSLGCAWLWRTICSPHPTSASLGHIGHPTSRVWLAKRSCWKPTCSAHIASPSDYNAHGGPGHPIHPAPEVLWLLACIQWT